MEAIAYQNLARVENGHWWFVSRRNIIKSVLSRLSLPSPEQTSLLEVGCGTGGNLDMLSHFGKVTAIEPDAYARSQCLKKGYSVIEGKLPETPGVAQNSMNVVAAFDVIEHLDDDQRSLATLRQLLKPGGYVVVTVPAFQFLWSEHDVRHHHKRRYTRRSLRHVFQEAGFSAISISYFNTLLFIPIVVARFLKKWMGSESPDENLGGNGPVNALLKILMSSEKHLLPFFSFPLGVSLIAVARKESTL